MGLDELRRRSRELLLAVLRSAAERRRVAAAAAAEKARMGLSLEDPYVEGELWDIAMEEAERSGMDPRSAGRLTWELVRDSLVVQGALRDEPMYPPSASEEDVVRLDLDVWPPLLELGGGGHAGSLEAAESELAGALGVSSESTVAFPSLREAFRTALRAIAEGVGAVLYEPVHPWVAQAVWEAGGRPYRVHREVGDCWRLRLPDSVRRGWIVVVENPDYVTGVVHGAGEIDELHAFSASSGVQLVHLSACAIPSGGMPPPPDDSVWIGGIGCALGSVDSGPAWIVARRLSGRLRRLRDSVGALPRPTDVSATASAISSGALARVRGRVSERLSVVRELLPRGLVEYCEPSLGPHLFALGPRVPAWKSGVALARGAAFGRYPDGFRINFMVDEDVLRLGLGRLVLSLLQR
ncbi:MAG: hypothetical protein ACP5ID_02375 [Conexivisphaera sp.]